MTATQNVKQHIAPNCYRNALVLVAIATLVAIWKGRQQPNVNQKQNPSPADPAQQNEEQRKINRGNQATIMGLCSKRYKSLSPIQNTKNGMIVAGKFCTDEQISICDIPGINELKMLYYDEYDYDPKNSTTGTYYKMSTGKDGMLVQYEKDVENFYKSFTGRKVTH